MPTHIPGAVPLADVAKQFKLTVSRLEDECRALHIYIGVDWTGRPAVADSDAYGLVSGKAREEHDHNAAWTAHQNLVDAWTRGRDEAVSVARGNAYRQAFLAGESNSKAEQAGLAAGREAGRRYEEEHPPPQWQGGEVLARRIYTSDSALRRLADKVLGGAA